MEMHSPESLFEIHGIATPPSRRRSGWLGGILNMLRRSVNAIVSHVRARATSPRTGRR